MKWKERRPDPQARSRKKKTDEERVRGGRDRKSPQQREGKHLKILPCPVHPQVRPRGSQ